jgi:hypothetical protein
MATVSSTWPGLVCVLCASTTAKRSSLFGVVEAGAVAAGAAAEVDPVASDELADPQPVSTAAAQSEVIDCRRCTVRIMCGRVSFM